MNEYNERAVVSIDEAGSIIANKNITIDILTDKLAAANQLIEQFIKAVDVVEIDSDECLDFDECLAMLVPMDAYHGLTEALAAAKQWKEQ